MGRYTEAEKRPDNILQQLFMLCLSILLAVFMLLPGSAIQARGMGQISISHEHPEAEIHFYHVAHGDPESGYSPTDTFLDSPIDCSSLDFKDRPEASGKLYDWIQETGVQPDRVVQLDESGKAVVDHDRHGLHLVTGAPYEHEGETYIPNPVLVDLHPDVDLPLQLKAQMLMVQTQEISVEKIWLDAEGEEIVPGAESIEAALLRNGEIYDTVVLGPDNDWHSSWILTDLNAEWSVREVNPPEGFTGKVDQSGLHFTIINTKKPEKPDKPDDPDPEDPKDPEDPEPKDPDPQKPPVPGGPGTSAQMQWQMPVLGMLAALLVFFLTSERQKKSRNGRSGWKKNSGKQSSGKVRHRR